MAQSSALNTLIDLAQKKSDEIAKELGNAMKYVEQAKEKLQLLKQYHDDYHTRLQHDMQSGITPALYQNYQSFLFKLEQAIKAQENDIVYAQSVVNERRSFLIESEEKRLSYSALHERSVKEQEKKEAKREQKSIDEYAARASASGKGEK